MHGEDVENFDRSSRMGMGAGYAPGDTVPFMVEPDLGYDKKSGTHHAYSNLNAGKKTGPIVDDPAKAYEEHKRAHFHMRFVAAVIDKQQVQVAQKWWGDRGVKIKHFGPTVNNANSDVKSDKQDGQ